MKTASHPIDELIESGMPGIRPIAASANPFWQGLRRAGSELWLDTSDLLTAEDLWTAEFSGLTTNNTLLRTEVRSGTYDGFLHEAAPLLRAGTDREARLEAAFALNARHALRLSRRFGCSVSLELHTDLADDVEGSVAYGLRYHALDPAHLVVKLPFTPEGLIAARILGEQGVRTNVALGFSARQNLIAAAVARPEFVNVFIGRLGAYLASNDLGDGSGIGERALLASQQALEALGTGTRQIAASLRSARQLRDLAGCDVFTIPAAIAAAAPRELDGAWPPIDPYGLRLSPAPGLARARPEVVWTIDPAIEDLAADLISDPASDADALRRRCAEFGCGDLFPAWTTEERARFADDGRIPLHHRWLSRIERGEAAIDSLLTAAGLAAFATDQAALDGHVLDLLSA